MVAQHLLLIDQSQAWESGKLVKPRSRVGNRIFREESDADGKKPVFVFVHMKYEY